MAVWLPPVSHGTSAYCESRVRRIAQNGREVAIKIGTWYQSFRKQPVDVHTNFVKIRHGRKRDLKFISILHDPDHKQYLYVMSTSGICG
jgi:hypothetical protein